MYDQQYRRDAYGKHFPTYPSYQHHAQNVYTEYMT